MNAENLLSPSILIEIIESKKYGVEYQPIVDITNQNIFAFECLARFFNHADISIPPDIVFAALHKSPLSLFQVEYEQKELQLSNAPNNASIFVNLDQDSYFSCFSEKSSNPFLQLFNRFQSEKIIVELIENSEMSDSKMSLAMINTLSNNKIKTAIDDVFNLHSMVSMSVMQFVNYIKLDSYVIKNKDDDCFLHLVRSIIDYARISGKKTILEGVESNADLLFAKELGVDYVQGYLYQDEFIRYLLK